MNFKRIKQIIAGSSIALASVVALAAPITGEIGYSSTDDQNDIERYFDTSINFLTTGDGEVDYATGDLSPLLGMSVASIDFTYDPFTPQSWSVGNFTFELTAVNVIFDDFGFLALQGSGMISHANYDDTLFAWQYSTQQLGNTFSAGIVPEPATLALLGAGLIGLAASRRSANKK